MPEELLLLSAAKMHSGFLQSLLTVKEMHRSRVSVTVYTLFCREHEINAVSSYCNEMLIWETNPKGGYGGLSALQQLLKLQPFVLKCCL